MEPTGEIVQDRIQDIFPEAERGIATLKRIIKRDEPLELHGGVFFEKKNLGSRWTLSKYIIKPDDNSEWKTYKNNLRNIDIVDLINVVKTSWNDVCILGRLIFEKLGKYRYMLSTGELEESGLVRRLLGCFIKNLRVLSKSDFIPLDELMSNFKRKSFSVSDVYENIDSIPDMPMDEQITKVLSSLSRHGGSDFLRSSIRNGYELVVGKPELSGAVQEEDSVLQIVIDKDVPYGAVMIRTVATREKTIEMYKKALVALGDDYVLTSRYPEVEVGKGRIYGNRVFYEVYGGPTVKMLSLTKFPPKVVAEIFRQMNYITYMLYANGIDHGHLHARNFNIRWFVTDGETKRVIFNPKLAFKTLQEMGSNATITPIVMVRDWDEAKSCYTNLE